MNANKTKRWFWVTVFLGILLLFALYLRAKAVPVRQFSDTSWFFHERERPTVVQVARDPRMDGAIKRAREDYLIAPAVGGRRWIHFGAAFTVEPHDLYLVFGNGEEHLLIIYRCSRENEALFWKATEKQSF